MLMLKTKNWGCYTAAFFFFFLKCIIKKIKAQIYESKHCTKGISSDLKECSVQLIFVLLKSVIHRLMQLGATLSLVLRDAFISPINIKF